MAGESRKVQHFDLERARFEAPTGYEDLTNYTFASPDGTRRLVVHFAERLPGHAALAAAVEGYRHQVQKVLKVGEVSASGMEVREDGTATITLSFAYDEGTGAGPGRRLREWSGFVQFNDGSGAQVAMTTEEGDPQAEAEFRQVLASVQPQARAASQPARAPAGFVRRQAGRVVLDVPEALRPPDCYQFVSDDKKVRLYLRISGAEAGAGGAEPAAMMGAPVPPGATRRKMEGYDASGYEMYETTHEGSAGVVTRHDCRQSKLLNNGVRVALAAQAHPDDDARMRAAFTALAASVREPS